MDVLLFAIRFLFLSSTFHADPEGKKINRLRPLFFSAHHPQNVAADYYE
jgi:hypothetical protein